MDGLAPTGHHVLNEPQQNLPQHMQALDPIQSSNNNGQNYYGMSSNGQ